MTERETREILDEIQRQYYSLLKDKVLHEKVDKSFKKIAYKVAKTMTKDQHSIEQMLRGRFL